VSYSTSTSTDCARNVMYSRLMLVCCTARCYSHALSQKQQHVVLFCLQRNVYSFNSTATDATGDVVGEHESAAVCFVTTVAVMQNHFACIVRTVVAL
jgi:hypothetical protein